VERMSPLEHARILVEQIEGPCDAFGIPLAQRAQLDARDELREAILPDFVRWLKEQKTKIDAENEKLEEIGRGFELDRETDDSNHPAMLRRVLPLERER